MFLSSNNTTLLTGGGATDQSVLQINYSANLIILETSADLSLMRFNYDMIG